MAEPASGRAEVLRKRTAAGGKEALPLPAAGVQTLSRTGLGRASVASAGLGALQPAASLGSRPRRRAAAAAAAAISAESNWFDEHEGDEPAAAVALRGRGRPRKVRL